MVRIAVYALMLIMALASCKGAEVKAPATDAPSAASVQEQEQLAMVKLGEMLDETTPLRREAAVPVLINGYFEVIENYPYSFIAEESYFRLMTIYLKDFYPSREAEAEALYSEYFTKYRNPQTGMAMTTDLARHYYETKNWRKLSSFTVPFMREFAKSGKYGDTVFLFYYSEAQFFLEKYGEARKGYKYMIKNNPNSRDSKLANARLKVIKTKLEQGPVR